VVTGGGADQAARPDTAAGDAAEGGA